MFRHDYHELGTYISKDEQELQDVAIGMMAYRFGYRQAM
jgi:hypothetical protein